MTQAGQLQDFRYSCFILRARGPVFAPVPGTWRVPGMRASIEPDRVTGSSRWLGVLAGSVTGRAAVSPQRCWAPWRVMPSRMAMSAQE